MKSFRKICALSVLALTLLPLCLGGCAKPASQTPAAEPTEAEEASEPKDFNISGFDLMDREFNTLFPDGTDEAAILEALGEPDARGELTVWGADGLEHQTWSYGHGLELNLSGQPGKAKFIHSVTLTADSPLKTQLGIGIGSTRQEVLTAYGEEMEPTQDLQKAETLTAGTVYGGMSFLFDAEKGTVTKIFIGAGAE